MGQAITNEKPNILNRAPKRKIASLPQNESKNYGTGPEAICRSLAADPAAQVPVDMKEKFPCIVCNINFDSTTMRSYHEKVAHNGKGQILFPASKSLRLNFKVHCN